MEIYGGRAGFNSVSFTGEKYQVLARFKDGEITTEIRLRKKNRITFFLSRMPFVRSFSMMFDLVIEHWKRFLLVGGVLFFMELFIGKSNSQLLYSLPINTLEFLLIFLIVAGFVIKTTTIGQYHSAEHMTANVHERKLSLTIDNVKKQPRIHVDCGTNLAIAIIICYSLLFWIFGDSVWVILASWSFGYELWVGKPKIIWDFILLIGKAAQFILFTSKPKERHLLVAMEAMKKLEEKEMANN